MCQLIGEMADFFVRLSFEYQKEGRLTLKKAQEIAEEVDKRFIIKLLEFDFEILDKGKCFEFISNGETKKAFDFVKLSNETNAKTKEFINDLEKNMDVHCGTGVLIPFEQKKCFFNKDPSYSVVNEYANQIMPRVSGFKCIWGFKGHEIKNGKSYIVAAIGNNALFEQMCNNGHNTLYYLNKYRDKE